MNKALARVIAAILALAAGCPSAMAEPPETAGQAPAVDGSHGGRLRHILDNFRNQARQRESYGDVVLRHINELKLSDEQVGKIERLHRENQAKVEAIAKRLRDTRRQAYRLFLNPASDEAEIRKAAKEHTAVFDELVETALQSRAAINAVLTPEQTSQLKSFKVEARNPHDQESAYP